MLENLFSEEEAKETVGNADLQTDTLLEEKTYNY